MGRWIAWLGLAVHAVHGHQVSSGMNAADVVVFPDARFAILVVANAGGKAAGDAVNTTKLRLVDLVQTGK